jgi:hypothetical protein
MPVACLTDSGLNVNLQARRYADCGKERHPADLAEASAGRASSVPSQSVHRVCPPAHPILSTSWHDLA